MKKKMPVPVRVPPETAPRPVGAPPEPSAVVPEPTVAYQMLTSWYDGENDAYKWGLFDPPANANDQHMAFGGTGQYWSNVAALKAMLESLGINVDELASFVKASRKNDAAAAKPEEPAA